MLLTKHRRRDDHAIARERRMYAPVLFVVAGIFEDGTGRLFR
jgi:hypothetical protein